MDTEAIVEGVVARYRREIDRYQKFVLHVGQTVQVELRRAGILATVQWRAKQPDSLRGKLFRESRLLEFADADEAYAEMRDLAGVRICTYAQSDRPAALRVVCELFDEVPGSLKDKDALHAARNDSSRWYRATHVHVSIRPDSVSPDLENLLGDICEIQITSLLQHSWNEVEHDIGYKSAARPLPADIVELLERLGEIREQGDLVIDRLVRADSELRRSMADRSILAFDDFVADADSRLRGRASLLPLDPSAPDLVEFHDALRQAGFARSGEIWGGSRPELFIAPQRTIAAINAQLRSDHAAKGLLAVGALLLSSEDSTDCLFVALLPAVAHALANGGDGRCAAIATAYLACADGLR